MDFISAFFGRFHPLLVHLPIGFLLLAFFFECLSLKATYKPLRRAVMPTLLLGSLFAIASAISGYFLRQEGGYDERLAGIHQNLGISTAVLSLAVYLLRPKMKSWVADPIRRKKARIALFVPLIAVLLATGHFGGSLTHGEDYLFAFTGLAHDERPDPSMKIKTIASIPDAILYRDVIQPILESRCYDCHSSTKQKGKLRLDKEEFISKGGEDGPVIRDGPADSSALFRRLILPIEDKHHMPPEEKAQLSSSEIALVKYWVEEKAVFDQPIHRFASNEKITAIIKSLQETPRESWVPQQKIKPLDEKTLRKLNDLGITPLALAAESNYRMVTFAGRPNVTDEQISALGEMKDQLVWLNLNYSGISDQQLKALSRLSNLRVLYLNYTKITDVGFANLSALPELRILSVVGTSVSDQSVPVFLAFGKLTDLFVYQSQLTPEGIQKISSGNERARVDTGNYVLEVLPTDTLVYKKTASGKE
ncbi:MAG TPA: c-type cytochrome domain-containing protein [Chryseosolibacter sp.]